MESIYLELIKSAVVKVLKDLLASSEFSELREKAISSVIHIAEEHGVPVDDNVVNGVVDAILSGGSKQEAIKSLIPVIYSYVQAKESPWKSHIILPLLKELRGILAD